MTRASDQGEMTRASDQGEQRKGRRGPGQSSAGCSPGCPSSWPYRPPSCAGPAGDADIKPPPEPATTADELKRSHDQITKCRWSIGLRGLMLPIGNAPCLGPTTLTAASLLLIGC
jgi:hypothetical protein